MAKVKVRPLNDKILVQRLEAEEKILGGNAARILGMNSQ